MIFQHGEWPRFGSGVVRPHSWPVIDSQKAKKSAPSGSA